MIDDTSAKKLTGDGGIFSRENLDAIGYEEPVHHSQADAELARDICDGKYGAVFFDDIVYIGHRQFSGHVYNLETANGFYAANGIITHNCRSSLVPVTKSFRELGIDADEIPEGTRASQYGQVSAGTDFGAWLKGQPREVIDDALGKGRADLFLSGKISMSQLVDPRTLKPLTLAELRARYD